MFQLTKVWIDREPGIGMVEIRYLWSPAGEAVKLFPPGVKGVTPEPVAEAKSLEP